MPTKVLVAEDDHTMVQLLHTLLKMEGFEVSTLDMNADITSELLRVKPGFLFMDVHLGSQSGIAILDSIRIIPEFASLKIIMTSGMDMREQCMRHGADYFILKPFMPDDLLSLLKDTPG
ncbi:MAG TPA: response regulator [Anaerolineales bacterium]|nr:response regulator [Anaerolineales bacterium]